MTPDQLKAIFDGGAIIIMFLWGLLVKYVPFLAKIPNALIPWLNAIGYIIAKFAIPEAHAGVSSEQGFAIGGILLGCFTNAVWARQLYEGFGRFLMEGVFKLKKATA
jgi:hypothetical protein